MRYIILLIWLQYGFTQAQIFDDFSDGNFTNAIEWKGDTSSFIVNANNQLQLFAEPTLGSQVLYIPSTAIDSGTWSFYCRMDFNPSSQNYTEIILLNPDSLFSPTEKVSIELGRNQDKITIRSFHSGTSEVLAESTNPVFTQNTNRIWCKVKNSASVYHLEYSLDSINWALPIAFNSPIQQTATFGVECHYSSSRKDKFYFDDFSISGHAYIDTILPIITANYLTDSLTYVLKFSESIDSNSIQLNTLVNLNHTSSSLSKFRFLNKTTLELELDNISYNSVYNLQIKGIQDLHSNTIKDTILSFRIQRIYPYDLEIIEIMIDPSPPVYLPEIEYIEVHNASTYPLSLKDCMIKIGEKDFTLPAYTLNEDSTLVIYPASAKSIIDSNHSTIFLETSYSLNNTSGELSLLNPNLQTIHTIQYSDLWYRDPNKQDGGWSLEQQFLDYPCLQGINWKASNDPNGGSPNYNHMTLGSLDGLHKLQPEIFIITDSVLQVNFPFSILSSAFLDVENYITDLEIMAIIPINDFSLEIIFNESFLEQNIYTLTLSNTLQPCFPIEWEPLYFGKPTMPLYQDLKWSEICFDVDGNYSEFIEFVNVSAHHLDIYDIALNIIKDSTNNIINCSNNHKLIPSGTYVVLAKNLDKLFENYTKHSEAIYIELDHWVSLDDKSGSIDLLNRSLQMLDSLCYETYWHSTFLSSTENVSLEKIDLEYPTCVDKSWGSAAETANFATPGYLNSQSLTLNASQGFKPSFSPNNDGYNDIWEYTMAFSNSENTIDAFIYNLDGFKVYTFSNGLSVGTSHTFIWHGMNDAGEPLPKGTYIITIRNRTKEFKWKKAISITD